MYFSAPWLTKPSDEKCDADVTKCGDCFASVLLVLLTGLFADLFSVLTNYGSELYATGPDSKGAVGVIEAIRQYGQ